MILRSIIVLVFAFQHISGRVLKYDKQDNEMKFVSSSNDYGPVPRPLFYKSSQSLICIGQDFSFGLVKEDCPLLRNYMRDIYETIVDPISFDLVGNCDKLNSMSISVMSSCNDSYNSQKLYPTASMDESYELNVTKKSIILKAKEVWGAMRGLETFSQMVFRLQNGQIAMFDAIIIDQPRFKHRGFMLDTSRHFLHKNKIFDTLRLMAMTKFNVFHWHIVDDESFPYSSTTFPQMSQKGAYNRYSAVYTQADIADVIEYARRLGIRVIPEFDTPGHTQSWGKGLPNLLTPCYSSGKPNGQFGPVDPSRQENYQLLGQLFSEVMRVFPDTYLHLGGDEVSFSCWQSNPNINAFMKKNNITTYNDLESYYINKLLQVVNQKKVPGKSLTTMVWQEVFDNKVKIPSNVIVDVWKGGWQNEIASVTKAGYTSVLSSCWYLNYISYGVDYPKYYSCDPQGFNGTTAQKNLVVGGEACMWGEYVDDTNVISRTWPRVSSVAEALWTQSFRKDISSFSSRIQSLQCRMRRRGYPAEPPNGASSCVRPMAISNSGFSNQQRFKNQMIVF